MQPVDRLPRCPYQEPRNPVTESNTTPKARSKAAAKPKAKKSASGSRSTPKRSTAKKSTTRTREPAFQGGHLVIVESPTKAKTLGQYVRPVLGSKVRVKAT